MRKTSIHSPWWIALIAAAGGGVGGALISGMFSYLSQLTALDAKMIELSVSILRAPPAEETTTLREWAIDVVNKHAGIRFSPVQRAILLNKELPFVSGSQRNAVDFDRAIEELRRRAFRPLPPPELGEPD